MTDNDIITILNNAIKALHGVRERTACTSTIAQYKKLYEVMDDLAQIIIDYDGKSKAWQRYCDQDTPASHPFTI